ncbi:MAG: AbgT family transporter [Zavarzinella sp.]
MNNQSRGLISRFLDGIEWLGNKLPDPAVLFFMGLILTWCLSSWLSGMTFTETVPGETAPIAVKNLLTLDSFAGFLSKMVKQFTGFHPLGVVLVALLGVGVAEYSGFLNAVLKSLLNITPRLLLTPMLILVAIMSHTAADAGYVLVIPIGGVMFYAAGRHPVAGIAAAFAGVSGGFSANFIASGLDPMLAGITQEGVAILNADRPVNPLCNIFFTAASSLVIILLGWFITDRIIEPRLKATEVDGNPEDMPKMQDLNRREKVAMWLSLASVGVLLALLVAWMVPANSSLRDVRGKLTSMGSREYDLGLKVAPTPQGMVVESVAPDGAAGKAGIAANDLLKSINGLPIANQADYENSFTRMTAKAPVKVVVERDGKAMERTFKPVVKPIAGSRLMEAIVPLIFLMFIVPGLVFGFASGKFQSHRDAVKGMTKAMETMGYYLVLVFFAALFIGAFSESNIGKLLAVKGANFLKQSNMPSWAVVLGIIFLTACANLLVGSASAKWAMLAPIFVPMLMLLGISPEMTQAAYRVGDSTTNIITPMMPYFPLVVVFCQKYVKKSGIGSLTALMLPYSICFLVCWTAFLLIYWAIGIPLGIEAPYTYQPS